MPVLFPGLIARLAFIIYLFCYVYAAPAGIVFLQQKAEEEHDSGANGKNLECVDVGEARGLRLKRLIDLRIGGGLSFMDGKSGFGKVLREALHRVGKVWIIDPGFFNEPELMQLRAARDQRGYDRGADAAAHIAHEVDDAGDRVVLFRGDSDVGHERNRDKQETQADHLRNAQPGGGAEANLQVDPLGRVVHSDGQGQPAEGNQPSRLNFGGQLTHDRHFDEQDDAARREGQSGNLRGVSEKCLKE